MCWITKYHREVWKKIKTSGNYKTKQNKTMCLFPIKKNSTYINPKGKLRKPQKACMLYLKMEIVSFFVNIAKLKQYLVLSFSSF